MACCKTGSSKAGMDGTGGRRMGGGEDGSWKARPVCILRGMEDRGGVSWER